MYTQSLTSAKQTLQNYARSEASTAAPELTMARERRTAVAADEVANSLATDSQVDLFSAKVVAGAPAGHAGIQVAPGVPRLPDPALKVSLDAEQYDKLTRWQRSAVPKAAPSAVDTDAAGVMPVSAAACAAASVPCGIWVSPWCLLGLVPTGVSCLGVAAMLTASELGRQPYASTCCGSLTHQLYEGAPAGADAVVEALRAHGSVARAEAGGYEALCADAEDLAPEGFHETANRLRATAAEEPGLAQAYGNLLPFRDRVSPEDDAFEAQKALSDACHEHRATLLAAGKPPDFIERSLHSHPEIQQLKARVARLRAALAAPTPQEMPSARPA